MNLWSPHYSSLISRQGPQSVCGALSMTIGMTLSRRQFSVGFFQSLHGPQSLTFYLCIFYFQFGAPPKNSGPNR